MDSLVQSYICEPLPQGHIRVLRLIHPLAANQSDKSLTWSLDIMPLFDQDESNAVSYDALSYTWGDLSTTYPLICGGKEL
jgi:hypothetical protein